MTQDRNEAGRVLVIIRVNSIRYITAFWADSTPIHLNTWHLEWWIRFL